MRLGFHLSIAGSLRRAVDQAQVLGCQALQIFVQNPRGWKWRPVAPAAIRDFCRARGLAGLGPLVVHLGYLPNLATADPALYALSTERLWRELELARADGSYAKRLRGLGQVDVLIVDDWAMSPLAEGERRAFLEICDERYLTRSTLLTSQLPVAKWHAQIGDPTVADSILDRLVHAAHRIELQGESMRKKKGGRGGKDAE